MFKNTQRVQSFFMRKILTAGLVVLLLLGISGAESFVFVPLWGNAVENVAQWKITSVPLSIEQLDLLYNVRETSQEYERLGYAIYDMELRLNRLKKDFAPQKMEFLVQMYDRQGKPLLEKDYADNLFVIERPDFSALNTAKLTLPGFVLDREPVRIKIWLKSYVDQNGQVKEIIKPKKKHKDKDKDTTIIIIKQ
ncbi:hypothetical protein NO2_1564 [Candidatus Termititenax persephonae]|uniref:Uncharacterized protein n=1 Tax=Candidatus Termititenax persephonae TaxID=2218525 RepID=A0A388TIQ3_9BACT|nr:hypothetical protein NO2_1564 [Candidatus Termititenax persephonae]